MGAMSDSSRLLKSRLEKLDQASCRRILSSRNGVDFSSNDYLGFSQDENLKSMLSEWLKEIPLGSSGSRLLRGQLKVFEEAEEHLADFCGRESALIFPSGYQANIGLLSALLGPEDIVFSDQFNHASIIDGVRLSGAHKVIYPHGNTSALRGLLKVSAAQEKSLKVIVTESLFSMDGDIAPLQELADLAEEFSALLVVDEAHATGLWGDFKQNLGGGLIQSLNLSSRVFATVHPAGKAFGAAGAWVCGDAILKDYLVNFSRPFIFSTAPVPFMAILLKTVLSYWRKVGIQRAEAVFENSKYLQKRLTCLLKGKYLIPNVNGPIIPVIVGDNLRTFELSQRLQRGGYDIRAIRPPTVSEGSARLRVTTNWSHSSQEIEDLAIAMEHCIRT